MFLTPTLCSFVSLYLMHLCIFAYFSPFFKEPTCLLLWTCFHCLVYWLLPQDFATGVKSEVWEKVNRAECQLELSLQTFAIPVRYAACWCHREAKWSFLLLFYSFYYQELQGVSTRRAEGHRGATPRIHLCEYSHLDMKRLKVCGCMKRDEKWWGLNVGAVCEGKR